MPWTQLLLRFEDLLSAKTGLAFVATSRDGVEWPAWTGEGRWWAARAILIALPGTAGHLTVSVLAEHIGRRAAHHGFIRSVINVLLRAASPTSTDRPVNARRGVANCTGNEEDCLKSIREALSVAS
jgi:hypothetical protein